jgi:hypothetical protein
MRVGFHYFDAGSLTPAAMARLLLDIEGLLFVAMALADKDFRDYLAEYPFEHFSYHTLVYFHGPADDPHVHPGKVPQFPGKLLLDGVNYNSPPKIDISIHASFDAQKILKTVFEFIQYLLTLPEQKRKLHIAAEKDRQAALSMELKNFGEMARLLDQVHDTNLRDRLEDALTQRILPLTDGKGDAPALHSLTLRGPSS